MIYKKVKIMRKGKKTIYIKELDTELIEPRTSSLDDVDSTGSKIVVIGKPGCFQKGTRVMMYDGTVRNVEEVRKGDIIMGSNCTKREVLELCRGREKMYSISYGNNIFPDTDPIVVNEKHILTLVNKDKNIIDIRLDTFLTMDKNDDEYQWIKIEPLFHQMTNINIDPYIIGRILVSGNNVSDVINSINEYKKESDTLSQCDYDNTFSDCILKNQVQSLFNDTGFDFIPNELLTMRKQYRIRLFRGIIDKIGVKDGQMVNLTYNKNKILEGIIFLSNSLGIPVGNIKNNSCSLYLFKYEKNLPQYPLPPEENYKNVQGHSFTFTITEHEEDDYYGFTLTGDGRFLLADCSVVHNTGKCLGSGTKLMTYSGIVTKVEDIKIGDLLMGDDSTSRKVMSLASGKDTLYKVIQEFGTEYVVNKDHILTLYHGDKLVDIPVEEYMMLDNKHEYKAVRASVSEFGIKKDDFEFDRTVSISDQLQISLLTSRESRLKFIDDFISFNDFQYNGNGEYEIKIGNKLIPHFSRLASSVGLFCKIIDKKIIIRMDEEYYTLSDFMVVSIPDGKYYGFELDGNGRFLLEDLTITHNTTLINNLLYDKKHIMPTGLVFSGTEDSNFNYRKYFPSLFVYNSLDEEVIANFIKRQKLAKRYLINPWSLLLIDDCTDDPKVLSKPLFQNLYKNGRHYKKLFILSLQYGMDIKPVIRTNIDGTFILRESNSRNRKTLWENYASCIPDFTDFCTIMDEITTDYTALYIHNKTQSNNFEDCVFYYQANPNLPDWRFGCDDYWDFHEDRFDTDYTDIF